ncbi:hypothetical protein AcV5_001662 [Taiwanofungus camphoratus]|nr:hypothetical protein AcV5_001662 [Antrodia cinnamomea]
MYGMSQDTYISSFLLSTVPAATVQTVTAFVADVYITTCLCLILQAERTGYSRTENVIHKLTLYVVNRGILTSLFQLLHLATYMATRRKSSLIFMIFHLPGSKAIYVNSLLAVLNARHVVMTTSGLTVSSDAMPSANLTSKDPHATSSSTLAPTQRAQKSRSQRKRFSMMECLIRI